MTTVSIWWDQHRTIRVAFFPKCSGRSSRDDASPGAADRAVIEQIAQHTARRDVEAPRRCVRVRQVHGADVLEFESAEWPEPAPKGDGLTTSESAVALVIVTADCLPVLLTDGERITAVHAGWRGLADGILERAVRTFPSGASVTAWVGPAIGPCCYEVGEEVAMAIARRAGGGCVRQGEGSRPHLDLPGAARQILSSEGIGDLRSSTVCTRCDVTWASYRRDAKRAGRNQAVIWQAGT